MHGQLGHGEDVRYLQNPRLIHRDLFDGYRIALIQCGEQYSAALSEYGHLYMWGKNSHVIPAKNDGESRLCEPRRIDIGDKRLKRLACGSWHAIGVTGQPEWQGWHQDFSESEVEDISDTDTESSATQGSKTRIQETTFKEASNLSRQKTVLSLGEFYAQTPGPGSPSGAGSPLPSTPYYRSYSAEDQMVFFYKQPDKEESVAIKNEDHTRPIEIDVVDKLCKFDIRASGDSANCETTTGSVKMKSIDFEESKEQNEPVALKQSNPDNRQFRKHVIHPKPPSMPRSKTFTGTSTRKEATSLSNKLSMSRMVDFSYMDNFQTVKKPVKKALGYEVTKVELKGSPVGEILSSHKHSAMHQPAKLTKAHTIYGRFNTSQRLEKNKSLPNFEAMMNKKVTPEPIQQQKTKIPKSGSFPDLSPQVTKANMSFMARKPLTWNKSPMFSSASSWQSRSNTGAWVIGQPIKKKEDKPK